jgi:hypothetical protein
MKDITFRPLRAEEFDAAYAILCEVTDWLLAKGIQQWVQPFPRAIYWERHDTGRNYGLFVGEALAAVASLMPSLPVYWGDYPADEPFVWLSTLATGLEFKGCDLGRVMLAQIDAHGASQGIANIYLDCAHGFLPAYYETAGYETLVRHQFNFPHGAFDAVLMCKRIIIAADPTTR